MVRIHPPVPILWAGRITASTSDFDSDSDCSIQSPPAIISHHIRSQNIGISSELTGSDFYKINRQKENSSASRYEVYARLDEQAKVTTPSR